MFSKLFLFSIILFKNYLFLIKIRTMVNFKSFYLIFLVLLHFNGTGQIIPKTTTINGGLIMNPISYTVINYNDSQLAPGVGYDNIIINGDVVFDGTLEIAVIDNMTYVSPTQPLEILTINGNISGEFSSFVSPDDFQTWVLDYGVKVPGKVILYNPDLHFLPVTWLSFDGKAKEEGNELIWKTASELNSDYFLVQYSNDGLTFRDLDKLKAAGQSQEISEYKYLHRSPISDIIYYRIKQVDFDGTKDYSNTLIVAKDKSSFKQANFFPNPSNGMVYFDKTHSEIMVRDISGKKVFHSQNISKSINLSQLQSGTYFIELDGKSLKLLLSKN
jgi:hypothetical protein